MAVKVIEKPDGEAFEVYNALSFRYRGDVITAYTEPMEVEDLIIFLLRFIRDNSTKPGEQPRSLKSIAWEIIKRAEEGEADE
ncbi:hypothetical protein [Geoglobus sp.]